MDNENINKEDLPYLIKITKFVYKQYKEDLKNNADSTYILCRKKLTRNWILSEPVNETKEFEIRRYGNLHMRRDRYDDRIVSIYNDRTHKYTFNVNEDDKRALDSIYGLDKAESNNTYNTNIKTEELIDNTYKTETVDNKTFMKMLINCTEKFGQAFKNMRG